MGRTHFVVCPFGIIRIFIGAPGFSENPLKCELSQEIAVDLKNIIKAMEELAKQMMMKRKLNANFLKIVELKSDPKAELLKTAPDGSGDLII